MADVTTVIMQGYALIDKVNKYIYALAEDEPLLTIELAAQVADIKASLIALEEKI